MATTTSPITANVKKIDLLFYIFSINFDNQPQLFRK